MQAQAIELSDGMRALVKRLAHVQKESRDKAVQKLKIFLASRRSESTSELDFLKIWKGLYYCMWMSDKTPIQQELATEIAQLVHILNDAILVALWLRTFHMTMRREWHMIDKYRLDKYYSLMRFVEHEAFTFVKKSKYDEDSVAVITEHIDLHFAGHVNSKRQGTGVVLHFVECFLIEMYKSIGSSVTTEQFEDVFLPLLRGYSRTESMERALLERTETAVFDAIGEEYWFCDCNGTKKSSSSENEEETTEEDSKEERSIFRKVHLARITAHVWAEASGTNTVQSRRKVLYAFHKRLKRLLKQSGTHYVVTLAPLALNEEDTTEQLPPLDEKDEKDAKFEKLKQAFLKRQAFENEANAAPPPRSDVYVVPMNIGDDDDSDTFSDIEEVPPLDDEEDEFNDSTDTLFLNNSLNDSIDTQKMDLSDDDDDDNDSDSSDGDGWESDTVRGDHGPAFPPGWNDTKKNNKKESKQKNKNQEEEDPLPEMSPVSKKRRVRLSMENNEFKSYNNSIRDLKKRKFKSASESPQPIGGILKSKEDRRHSIEKGNGKYNNKKNKGRGGKIKQEMQFNFASNGYGGSGGSGGNSNNNKGKKKKKKRKR